MNDNEAANHLTDPFRPASASVLVDWFGDWHTFRNSEVLQLHIEREGASYLDLWAAVLGPLNPETGRFIAEKQCLVRVWMHDVQEVDLSGFGQNVLNELSFERTGDLWNVHLDACAGIGGHIVCERIDFTITPGGPPRKWRQEARGVA